jgi:DNA-binding LacI/PurR family transcriptional regulator
MPRQLSIICERWAIAASRMSVIGIDDVTLARRMRPPLTSIRQPLESMGQAAVRMLLERMNAPGSDAAQNTAASVPVRISFPVELIVRQSTPEAPQEG